MENLLKQIKRCTLCQPHLPLGVNPVVAAHRKSTIAIIGQAPGKKVHNTGVPWDDKSGERLRDWLGVDTETFYNEEVFALIPMGFCYPGKGKSGDLPPRKECAPQWHPPLLKNLTHLKLTILVGSYAQKYYLQAKADRTLTETVRNYNDYLPNYFPLPHPSPRNNIWLKKNDWFLEKVIPDLKQRVAQLI